jgi:hypothetical protein
MSLNLRCVFLGHKWMPGEATNEPGAPMICKGCGRLGRHVQFAGRERKHFPHRDGGTMGN